MRCAIAIILVIFISAIGFSATIYVPDSYAKIQDAINASTNGDTIIVRPGTFAENIDFVGKAITLKSELGASATVIDGKQAGSVVVFQYGETASSVLEGFNITNGSGTSGAFGTYGGGIYCVNFSSPIITDNIISKNTASREGGGVFCRDSNPEISSNHILGNTSRVGGGICSDESSLMITSNKISGNSAEYGGGVSCHDLAPSVTNNIITGNIASVGGGVYINYSYPNTLGNTISENKANAGGGILCGAGHATITNTILWDNIAIIVGSEIHLSKPGGGQATVKYSDVKGGWSGTGNIDIDPLFVDPARNDYHLKWPSPCRNAGDNNSVTELYDFEGDPRIAQGTVDMGADEFYFHLYSMGDVLPGSPIDIKVVGVPGLPALLALGTGIQNPPQSTQHGDLWLKMPLAKQWSLGSIPSTGILTMLATVPSGWPVGSTHPFQALIGPWGGTSTKLTNLLELTVE